MEESLYETEEANMAFCTRLNSVRYARIFFERRWLCIFILGTGAILGLAAWAGASPTPAEVQVPVIKGDVGTCTADFAIRDSENKPIYDAKIRVSIRYGFMGQRKIELEIGTNSDGKARFEGLPDPRKKPKGAFEYQIRSGELTKTIVQDPLVQCTAKFDVVMQAK
jgi:hypothetical protein